MALRRDGLAACARQAAPTSYYSPRCFAPSVVRGGCATRSGRGWALIVRFDTRHRTGTVYDGREWRRDRQRAGLLVRVVRFPPGYRSIRIRRRQLTPAAEP